MISVNFSTSFDYTPAIFGLHGSKHRNYGSIFEHFDDVWVDHLSLMQNLHWSDLADKGAEIRQGLIVIELANVEL